MQIHMPGSVEQKSAAMQQETTFAQRVAAGRKQAFVGRRQELQAFDALLRHDSGAPLWFIFGPGGVGKTTLLQAFCAQAQAQDVPVVQIDARNVRSNPPAALHALESAAGNRSLEAFCTSHATPVLMIDTFEEWQDMEWWLREHLLPRMPSNLLVVIASRSAPSGDWATDPGWRTLMRITRLDDLDEREASDYLALRGVEGPSRQTLIGFSGGRPLVLALGADMAAQGHALQTRADTRPIIERLVERFTREAECPDQRQALDAAAIVRVISEGLLARMLGIDDAGQLYDWLSRLSFMERGPRGIFPHDQVRETLIHDMPQRFPGRYETCVQRAFDWIVDQIEATDNLSWTGAAQLAADGMYALRELDVVQHFLYPKGARSLYIERAGGGDWPILAEMVAYHEGAESRSWFEFWRQRAPDAVFVVRDPAGVARGFFMKLDMESLQAADRDADPLTACLWQHAVSDVKIDPGAHVPFIRFWLTADYAQSQSPEKTVIMMAINSYNLMAKNLRLTAQVFGDSAEWVAQARALGIARLEDSDTRIGGITWRIYYNDWQRESPARYYRRFAERCIAFDAATAGAPVAAAAPDAGLLDEAAFHAAVADALKSYHVVPALKKNLLLGSALVLAHTERGADENVRVRVLREQISQAVQVLAHEQEPGQRNARVLQRAYLKAAISQKQAADASQMGYSTYRRHLAEARKTLAAELWRAEIAQR